MSVTAVKWFRFPQANGDVRYWLFVGSERTPFFIDVACHRAHYSMGHRIGLWGSGLGAAGGAGFCGGFDRLSDAKEAGLSLITEPTHKSAGEEAEGRANSVSANGK